MRDSFLVAAQSKAWRRGDPGLVSLLQAERLYKSLSLLLARNARVHIPPSLLLLAVRRDLIAKFATDFGYPLMIRVDYRSRPKAKPLGGVPLYSVDTMERVCENLVRRGCLPLFHPHLDRFKDIFSCGVLLTDHSHEVEVEIVGKGFDAGDLRLGKAIPHETFQLNLTAGSVGRHTMIADDVYRRERATRAKVVSRLRAYSDFVNQSATLLADLAQFDSASDNLVVPEVMIPSRYEAMPTQCFAELLGIIRVIKSDVLRFLPHSKVYVASLSFLPVGGWTLWDVYGDWYLR